MLICSTQYIKSNTDLANNILDNPMKGERLSNLITVQCIIYNRLLDPTFLSTKLSAA